MCTNTERLVNQCSTIATCLCREAGIHSNDLMTSSCSLVFKDLKELTPCGVQDGLRHMMVLNHVGDSKVFYGNKVIAFSVLLCHLEMMVTTLAVYLQMGLRRTLCSFTLAVTPFLATTHLPLLTPQGTLRGAIETWIRNGVALTIGQEGLETDINANVRMFARGWVCSV